MDISTKLEQKKALIVNNYEKSEIRKKYVELADSSMQRQCFEEAVYFYCEALKLNSNHSRIHASLGNALLNMKKIDSAIRFYRQAIEIKSNSPGAFKKMGDALQMKGNLDGAIICYQQALKLNPRLLDICNLLGKIFLLQGKSQEAQQYFDAFQKLKAN